MNTLKKNKLISQGAEAKIYLISKSKARQTVKKERIPKGYRHPQLDTIIRIRRTKSEGKILHKAHNLDIHVPRLLNANKKGEPNDKFSLEIEYINGKKLSETLNNYNEKKQFQIMKQVGKQVGELHKNNIIHGDLTTSNIILKKSTIYVIDFGLGFISAKQEDKAVDIHLIKQALKTKHFQNWKELFKHFIKGYVWKDSKKIIKHLEIVEKRGRHKHQCPKQYTHQLVI